MVLVVVSLTFLVLVVKVILVSFKGNLSFACNY